MGSHFSSQGGSWSPRRDAGPRRCCSPQGASGLGVRLHPHGEWMEDLQVVPGAPATERELGHVGKPDVRTWAPGQWCQLRAPEEEGSKPLCGRKVNLKKKKKKCEGEPATTWGHWGNGDRWGQEVLHVGDEAPRPRSGRQAACACVPGTPGFLGASPEQRTGRRKRQVCTCLKSRTSDHTHLLAPPATSGRPPFPSGASALMGSRGAVPLMDGKASDTVWSSAPWDAADGSRAASLLCPVRMAGSLRIPLCCK